MTDKPENPPAFPPTGEMLHPMLRLGQSITFDMTERETRTVYVSRYLPLSERAKPNE